MAKPISLKQFIINNLRRATYKWGPKNECKKNAKIARNQYRCAKCDLIYPNKHVNVDHIQPVVDPIVGFKDWNTYIPRMFCDLDGYQLLCTTCHDKKTAEEQSIRQVIKELKKS